MGQPKINDADIAGIIMAPHGGMYLPPLNNILLTTSGFSSFQIYGNSTGKTLIVEDAIIWCTASNAVTVGPTLSIGNGASGANSSNIFAPVSLSTNFTLGSVYHFGGPGRSLTVSNGGSVYFAVQSPATATTLTASIIITGFFV